jgi:hypothetical protein
MRGAVYNSAIPDFILNTSLNTSNHALRFGFIFLLCIFIVLLPAVSHAADWTGPEQQLARKIVAVTGPGAVALSIENRSSLSRRDSEIIQNGLRNELAALACTS